MIGWTDSTAALGGSASFNGTPRALSNGQAYNYIVATSYADQTGTLNIQQSLDGGATWQTVATAAATANTAATAKAALTGAGTGTAPAQYRVLRQRLDGSGDVPAVVGLRRVMTAIAA